MTTHQEVFDDLVVGDDAILDDNKLVGRVRHLRPAAATAAVAMTARKTEEKHIRLRIRAEM